MTVTTTVGRRQFDTRSSRIVPNVMPALLLIDENIYDAMFLSFYSRVPVETSITEKFEWDVDEFLALNDALTAAVASTTTTILPITTPGLFIPNVLWINQRTNEIVKVRSVNTGQATIEVDRAVTALNASGGTAAANMNSGDVLIRLSPVVGENNVRQVTQTTTPNQIFNYSQAMRWELAMSRRQMKRTFLSGEAEFPYQIKKILLEARKQINGVFLDGARARWSDPDQGDITTTQGIRGAVTSNIMSVNGTLYENAFDSFLLTNGLRFGSREKVLFCSVQAIGGITQMVKDRVVYNLQLGTQKQPVGIQVIGYTAPNGRSLAIVEDRFLSENHAGESVGCDMTQLKRRVFSGHGINDDLHIQANTQDPDDPGRADTLYADMGFQYGIEKHHFRQTGITGGAKGTSLS